MSESEAENPTGVCDRCEDAPALAEPLTIESVEPGGQTTFVWLCQDCLDTIWDTLEACTECGSE